MNGILSDLAGWFGSDAAVDLGLLAMGVTAVAGLLWHAGIPIVQRIRIMRAVNAAAYQPGWPPAV